MYENNNCRSGSRVMNLAVVHVIPFHFFSFVPFHSTDRIEILHSRMQYYDVEVHSVWTAPKLDNYYKIIVKVIAFEYILQNRYLLVCTSGVCTILADWSKFVVRAFVHCFTWAIFCNTLPGHLFACKRCALCDLTVTLIWLRT